MWIYIMKSATRINLQTLRLLLAWWQCKSFDKEVCILMTFLLLLPKKYHADVINYEFCGLGYIWQTLKTKLSHQPKLHFKFPIMYRLRLSFNWVYSPTQPQSFSNKFSIISRLYWDDYKYQFKLECIYQTASNSEEKETKKSHKNAENGKISFSMLEICFW